MPNQRQVSERAVVALIGAVQFVNILDFVMVMPLGPDFAKELGIASSHIGIIGGAYTAAASVAGLAGGYFLDRFDRRKALAVSMLGLVVATAAGGFATGMSTLMLARVVAGIFGGPATSLSLSIIADLVPVERRGRALGAVMGAFSVASVAGVPMALKLAEFGGWRVPFFAVAAMGLLVVLGAIFYLPPVRGHLDAGPRKQAGVLELLANRDIQLSYVMTALVMMAGFVLIPNLSAYLQQNVGYPRDLLWLPYFIGGIASFATLRVAGPMVDRYGSFKVARWLRAGAAVHLRGLRPPASVDARPRHLHALHGGHGDAQRRVQHADVTGAGHPGTCALHVPPVRRPAHGRRRGGLPQRPAADGPARRDPGRHSPDGRSVHGPDAVASRLAVGGGAAGAQQGAGTGAGGGSLARNGGSALARGGFSRVV